MKATIIAITTTLLLGATGCNTTSEKNHQHESSTEEQHQHNSATSGIVLNNGKKWKVNAEMLPPIEHMEVQINNFSGSELQEYTVLAATLKTDYEALINSCTMTGTSHDELHKWLLPFIESVKQLAAVQNTEQASTTFGDIKQHMEIYHTYFE